ncbi:hypothetical protein BP5796_03296 [Coleophoma crateriformis]|uniref:Uncharacterized protein n=1 Tax=Coleophoma crateriformis TaxID=565419 RepID=A0A3D8SMU3_9HELO|nr:hypothetical protein BP5796_03296 [Coleophoma crateriformis]
MTPGFANCEHSNTAISSPPPLALPYAQQGIKNLPQRHRSSSTSHSQPSPSGSQISNQDELDARLRHDSVISSVKHSQRSHQEYLDSLILPSKEGMDRISTVQEAKEEEVMQKRLETNVEDLNEVERTRAAGLIQRNYRGHRARRELAGMGLDPSTRWVEAVKEARYRKMTEPRPRASGEVRRPSVESEGTLVSSGMPISAVQSFARQNWKKVGLITRRAGGDEESDSGESEEEDTEIPEEERLARKKRKAEEKAVRQKAAKIMDLQYFLEMVDLKHRYGSNLRTYHEEWKQSDTHENFFYWLDHGEGRYIDCQGCPRERLDREQVRYLSKEERLNYLVKIDKEGRLCWAKNGARIDTTEKWKDSIKGIVPDTDETPPFAPVREEAAGRTSSISSVSSTSSQGEPGHKHQNAEAESSSVAARADKYATPGLDNARGVKKVKHVSAATIFNKLLRGSVKKNTWIFVADTSFRLYVGIKQSGAFQHSSFLHGSRISAAGSIKIKDGRLSKLSPLSGHYRPPVANFRAFVHSLKDNGVDMSHVSISRSYAVLVGLEAYVKTRKKGKKVVKNMVHAKEKILSPAEVAKQEEEQRDKSESAALERRFLEVKQKADAGDDAQKNIGLFKSMSLGSWRRSAKSAASVHGRGAESSKKERATGIEAPGPGPENAIAPEGHRNLEH